MTERSRSGKAARAKVSDEARFLLRWIRNPLRTGAVVPSSKSLAKAMAAEVPVEALDDPATAVVELGPGTGVVTQALIEAGVAEERLVLLEYSPEFCSHLCARFPRATIVQGDAYSPDKTFQEVMAGRERIATVSSLPLMARPDEERRAALAHHLQRMAPGRPFIQFTYAPTFPVHPQAVEAHVSVGRWVKLNLPPARVLVYRRAVA